mgnify:CR=1 FL=1
MHYHKSPKNRRVLALLLTGSLLFGGIPVYAGEYSNVELSAEDDGSDLTVDSDSAADMAASDDTVLQRIRICPLMQQIPMYLQTRKVPLLRQPILIKKMNLTILAVMTARKFSQTGQLLTLTANWIMFSGVQ